MNGKILSMRKMRTFLVVMVMCLKLSELIAQSPELKIIGKPEMIASEIVIARDPSGDFCAAIKITSNLDDFKYDSYYGIVKVDKKPGEDIIYLRITERVLEVYHSNYKTLKIILTDFGIQLKEREVWQIRITGETPKIYVPTMILTEPEDVTICIDGKNLGIRQTHPISVGEHTLDLKKDGFIPISTRINVTEENYLFRYNLSPILTNMVFVPGGTFTMGNIWSGGDSDEKPAHKVELDSFYIGKYEVTQKQYETVMGNVKNWPSNFGVGDSYPAYYVSWIEAVEFCNKLSEIEGLTSCYAIDGIEVRCDFNANGYRLPTEAEWEYAARGGGRTDRKWSGTNSTNSMGNYAWYNSNSDFLINSVGAKKPNDLGIYDMSGNVWEWCWDWYGGYSSSEQTNPSGSSSGTVRVRRGGSYYISSNACRTANRSYDNPSDREFLGFRVVRGETTTISVKADGSEIYLNDTKVGNTSFFAEILPGEYLVKAEKFKHYTDLQNINIKTGDNPTIILEPKPMLANLSIAGQPPETNGAHIFLDDRLQQEISPAVLPVLVGEYDVTLKHPKFLDTSQKVSLSEGEHKELIFEMHPYLGSQLYKYNVWKRRKWMSFAAAVTCFGAGYYCNWKGDNYYKDYQQAQSNSLAVAAWSNMETFNQYRNITYSMSIAPLAFGVYSWIKQLSYRDLKK